MQVPLDGKVALVTGASSGIGRAIALAFGANGARVTINCHQRLEAAQDVARQIREAGGEAKVYQADVTNGPAVRKMVADVEAELGPIDILVNNTGAAYQLFPFAEMTEEFFDNVMSVNLRSTFLVTRAIVPGMIQRKRGSVINLSSVAARTGGGPGELAYVTAKGGVSAFTRALAKELGVHGIRANTLAPGPIDTPFHQGVRSRETLMSIAARVPLGRIGLPDDLVGAALLLASEAGAYITGQCIEVNGGFWVS